MDLKTRLINAVRMAQSATDKAAAEYDRVQQMYMMTDEGKVQERNRLFTIARNTSQAAYEKGLADILEKCGELDAQEQAEAERRAVDSAYLERLERKLTLVKGLEDVDNATLTTFFAEFANDPIAVAAINKVLPADKAFHFAPENMVGNRQKHLKTTVRKIFDRAMAKAGTNPESYSVNPAGRAAELDAFCAYVNAQTDDFSRPDRDVWEEIYETRKRDNAPAAPEFDLLMSMGL